MFKNRCDYKQHASGSVYSTVNVCLWNDWDDPTCQMVEQLQKLCAHISVISCLTVSGFGPVVAHTCCFLLALLHLDWWCWLKVSLASSVWLQGHMIWDGCQLCCDPVHLGLFWPQSTCNWAQSAKTSRRGPDVPAVWCVSVLATCCLFLVTAFFACRLVLQFDIIYLLLRSEPVPCVFMCH